MAVAPDDIELKRARALAMANARMRAAGASPAATEEAAPESPWSGAGLKRQAGLLGRSALDAVAGLPLMAGDFGVALGNLGSRAMGGSEQELPSAGWKRGLTMLGLPEPQNTPEKIGHLLNTTILGGALPSPAATTAAVPKNFVSPAQMKNSAPFAKANEAGYVVPPATVQPSLKNRLAEALGGKVAMQQDARMANTPVTENLSNRAFGLPEGAGPVSTEDLAALRQAASPAYEAMRGLGTVKADQTYLDALTHIGAKQESASRTFGGPFADSAVKPYLAALAKEDIPASDAVDATKMLRELADKAFASGDKSTGNAFKAASNAIESLLERRGDELGKGEVVDSFRAARKLIAQTYSAEKAVNDAAGTFNPRTLAAQLKRGKPLEGDLRSIGEFGARFPKISEPLLESPTRYSDVAVPAGLSLLAGNPAPLALPLTREAMRAYLLSPQHQRQVLQSMTQPQTAGAPATAQALARLLATGVTQ